jgi:exosortase/archaeosortase family protein
MKVRTKLFIWFISCLVILALFFSRALQEFYKALSWEYLRSTGMYPWAVLSLCFLWLYLKRDAISEKMQDKGLIPSPLYILIGILTVVSSLVIANIYPILEISFVLFILLLSFTGLFALFFGKAALIPSILLGVYGFTLAGPLIIARLFEVPFSLLATWFTVGTLKLVGISVSMEGQLVSFLTMSGDSMSVFIDSRCSGSASLTVFIALFILMMLDRRLPSRKATQLFLFGIAGTFLQNILRLVVVILAGHFYGSPALWKTHDYAGYIIFPAWFAIFAYIYLGQAREITED